MNRTSAPKRLVAVVVTFNRLEKLKETLHRLLESPVEELSSVVVVDNASTDGTGDWLSFLTDDRLDLILSDTNTGGAGGFEMGMRHAMEAHQPDWLVVMDDDGRPEPGALAVFHGLPDGKWDAVAAAVYFPSGEICEMNRPSRNPFWHWKEFLRTLAGGGRSGFHIPPSAYDGEGFQIDVTSFVGFFVSAEMVRRIGYPDPALFIYGDDGIYTLGLSKSGGRIGFEPSVRFEHDLTSFSDQAAQSQGKVVQRGRLSPLWKVYYYHRNLLIMYRLAAGVLFWPALLVVLPKWIAKSRHYGEEKSTFLRLLKHSIIDAIGKRRHATFAEIRKIAKPDS
ncbi:glycosyltransferase [Shimia sp. R9_1]|uniref:glycosyltransferase n=1 Tax=Shimia sp. R9_1 TaxID=2821111 RepID=UPI001AD96F00|nr:glycosyltransferase [Shimia sp. R9_1]